MIISTDKVSCRFSSLNISMFWLPCNYYKQGIFIFRIFGCFNFRVWVNVHTNIVGCIFFIHSCTIVCNICKVFNKKQSWHHTISIHSQAWVGRHIHIDVGYSTNNNARLSETELTQNNRKHYQDSAAIELDIRT